ncbi:two-component regulator propeller domain-containing protein [Agriterribacter sp.]|uniref:ligand-binding sensor domain-containing protein n=1 Tax=Agriterribacter sp. TaxID=2821509 RepID=UPI002B933D5D|nr:two-component regulator propeller domain-containing protein [Agriterribacter sp.]HRP57203.1 two-component regulator propeller domain-containing protein [Agriterribacter sp.]
MRKTLFILFASLTLQANAQNLFPIKLENCKTEKFCLDCGDIKAGYEENEFTILQDKLNKELNLQGIKGAVKFQVLVDAKGRACVLSHTDQSNNPISLKIIEELNKFKKWTPAITSGKKEEKSSINLIFVINDNKISGQIERVDMNAFKKSFDAPKNPEIFNTTYDYKNENFKNYKITVWNDKNSNLPNNMNDNITIDKNGLIWLTVDEGLVTFDGKEFKNAEQNITDKGKFFAYYALSTDNNNVKWVYGKNNIYSFDNAKWTKYDSTDIGIDGAYEIVNNTQTGEVFFCSDEGLTIYKDGKWTNLNKSKLKDLPSNRVTFAKRDSKNRIWIGTFSGTAMIGENNQITNFENTNTILKGKCITSMDEDENSNLFFTLYEFDRKEKGKVNNDEGIAVRYADGTFKQFTTENSGMPFNHTNCVLYDKNEKVLWISTDRAGLVRYDLKDGWENYDNQNSDIPTSYISTMTFDNNGNLYLATRQGLVKIERKQ